MERMTLIKGLALVLAMLGWQGAELRAQDVTIDRAEVLRRAAYSDAVLHTPKTSAPALGLTGSPSGLTERLDGASANSQYVPLSAATAPRGVAADDLQSFVRSYLADNREKFKVDPELLVPADRPIVYLGKQVIVSFSQQLAGAQVENALVQATFKREGEGDDSYRLVDITNQTYGELNADALTAQLAEPLDDPNFDQMAILDRQDVITPVFAGGTYSYEPGRRFTVEDQNMGYVFLVSVSRDGTLLRAVNQLQAFQGEVTANVFERGYFNGITAPFPLKHAMIGDAFTSGTGFISLPDGTYTLSLFSGGQLGQPAIGSPERRINIIDFKGTAQPAGFETEITLQGGRATLGQLSDSDFTALNAFVAINRIFDFALLHLDGAEDRDGIVGNEVAFLTKGIDVLVNQPVVNAQSRCNAFFNPTNNTLNFFEANGPCGNFGQLNDVLYHEWGHALDNAVGPTKGITDGAFSEGLSDVISGYFTGDSRVAPGFTTNNVTDGLRELNNTAKVGDQSLAGVHAQGTIIGGAFWDLRRNFESRYGASGVNLAEKLFFQHLLITDTFTQSYTNVLRLDDDDGDLTNGTPNFCLITDAFARHALANARACVDEIPQVQIQILDEDANGGLMVEVSLPDDGTTAAICLGEEQACSDNPFEDVAMQAITNPLAAAQGRKVFRSVAGVPVSGSSVTFSVMTLTGNRTLSSVEGVTLERR